MANTNGNWWKSRDKLSSDCCLKGKCSPKFFSKTCTVDGKDQKTKYTSARVWYRIITVMDLVCIHDTLVLVVNVKLYTPKVSGWCPLADLHLSIRKTLLPTQKLWRCTASYLLTPSQVIKSLFVHLSCEFFKENCVLPMLKSDHSSYLLIWTEFSGGTHVSAAISSCCIGQLSDA